MKKISREQRYLDVQRSLLHRQGVRPSTHRPRKKAKQPDWCKTKAWFEKHKSSDFIYSIEDNRNITLHLPKEMNFSDHYEITAKYITAIRLLTDHPGKNKKRYKLTHVKFDNLTKISSSAALVLTAELSKWDDLIRNNLTPRIDNWNKEILQQFIDLGFFDLFAKAPNFPQSEGSENIKLVRYIKGSCGDSRKTTTLKEELQRTIGETISKWTFLHCGLTEAITNVSHHAYPKNNDFSLKEKNWYLTGSYNRNKNQLKISFYDQGVGIPKSLPKSEIWEKILGIASIIGVGRGKLDETLLKAAMELDRTSTGETDRGKGLQDLLEFIRKRGEGYLTVISRRGLYRMLIKNSAEIMKSHSFNTPLQGTLIIWNVSLTLPD